MNSERHNYEYEVDLCGDSAPAHVVRMVGNDKYVLEVGAGPGSITKHLQSTGDCKVVALEIDEDAIEILKPYCQKVYKANLNDSTWPNLVSDDGLFDTIVAADVLEHVYDPWSTLKSMTGLLSENGEIVISLPHVGHSSVVACLLDEDFKYRDWGLLDRTHIRFFGLKNIQALFNDAGLHIKEAKFVIAKPEESELSERWNNLSSEVKNTLSSFKYGNVYQVVVKAVPASKSTSNIDLMAMPVVPQVSNNVSNVKIVLKKIIPNMILDWMRTVAHKL